MNAIILQSQGRRLAVIIHEGKVVDRIPISQRKGIGDCGVPIVETLSVTPDEFTYQYRMATHKPARYGELYAEAIRAGLSHREARAEAEERYHALRAGSVPADSATAVCDVDASRRQEVVSGGLAGDAGAGHEGAGEISHTA